jgi:hypothetical protein
VHDCATYVVHANEFSISKNYCLQEKHCSAANVKRHKTAKICTQQATAAFDIPLNKMIAGILAKGITRIAIRKWIFFWLMEILNRSTNYSCLTRIEWESFADLQ